MSHSLQRAALLLCALVSIFVYAPRALGLPESNLHIRDGLHVPCTFFDTVNVTGDVHFDNGSYLHEGIIIPRHLVGLYDYIYKDLVQRIDVEPHPRGCICKLKTCINLCCPWGTVYSNNHSECINSTDDIQWPAPELNITRDDGELVPVNIFKQFAVQNFRPCEEMFSLQPETLSFDEWHIFENGSMLRVEDNTYMSKNEYCLIPTLANESDTVYIINPANCDFDTEFSTMKIINAYAMLFSIPFMVLTIVVYLTIPELRNQHGKSLVCYLLGLTIGYTLLSAIALLTDHDMPEVTCKTIGYTAYYFFMAAFLWLSVISFDLWHNFRGTHGVNRFQEKKRFLFYSLYSWGLAAVFLVFTWFAQEIADIPMDLKPGIGWKDLCWLEMKNWSAMIYFFGPILVVMVSNIVMFVMTSLKIHRVQREMARIMAREDSTRNLRTEKDKFGLYLRLFIVMGATWSLEILSYFVGSDKYWAKIFYLSDICNAVQGFLIFMLFVMKKKVKNLITNRYSSTRSGSGGQRQSQYSTKTTSSSVSNLAMTGTNNATEKPLMQIERNRNSAKN